MDLNQAMSPSPYPRDLVGYGRAAPHPHWPGEARIAVQFVINYEEGGENNILHGDAASEAFLSEIVGAQAWPGQRHMNMESIYEYGSRAGFWRLWRMFSQAGLPVTVFGVATAMEEGTFLYTADSYADELPYWVEGPSGPQLVVPYTLDANDMRFATPQGFN